MKRIRSFLDRRRQSKGSAQQVLADTSESAALKVAAQAPAGTLTVTVRNDTTSNVLFAYVTGQAIDNGNRIVLIRSDGKTPYFPDSPSAPQSPLQQDCAIPVGAPGNVITLQVPRIAGGRIWFSIGARLTFLLNPGPALVEPSVSNPSDPSINVNWGFCEFTFNAQNLYANISYVDFVSIPIALSLVRPYPALRQHVSGFKQDGLVQIANGLRAQNAKDGAGWDRLIVPTPGNPSQPLRILSPNQARIGNPGLLANYFDGYVNQVYQKFSTQNLSLDTQAQWGVVTGRVPQETLNSGNPQFNIGGTSFSKPSTSDIWTCSTGPFATGSDAQRNAIIPRLSAAFNRSTLLSTNTLPSAQNLYYSNAITNHYSRIVHSVNLDTKGYAFPYDDVQPTGGRDASGKVQAGDTIVFQIAVGGSKANTIDSDNA